MRKNKVICKQKITEICYSDQRASTESIITPVGQVVVVTHKPIKPIDYKTILWRVVHLIKKTVEEINVKDKERISL